MSRLVLLATLLLSPAVALAQHELPGPAGEPSDADIEQARALYVRAGEELDAGRWSDAADLFAQSYRLSGVPAALFNHATALRSLGRHRDARDAFAQLLRAHPDLEPERRAAAETRMREEAGRVALVIVSGLSEAPDARLTLDGASVTRLEQPPTIETDAGAHTVGVDREGYAPWRRELTLADGQRETVQVELEAVGGDDAAAWVLSILAVLVVGGAITGAVVGYDQAQLRAEAPFAGAVIQL